MGSKALGKTPSTTNLAETSEYVNDKFSFLKKTTITLTEQCYKYKKNPRPVGQGFVFALLIFPSSRPLSIVSACELNFCVRDGNRWTLTAINTNSLWGGFEPPFISKVLRLVM